MPLLEDLSLTGTITSFRIVLACLFVYITYIGLKIAKVVTSPLLKIKPVSFWHSYVFMYTTEDVRGFQLRSMEAGGDDGIYRYYTLMSLEGLHAVGVYKPEYVRHVLVTNAKNYQKPKEFTKVMKLSRGGIFLAEGDEHTWQKKLMTPMFSNASVRKYMNIFESHCTELVKLWSSRCLEARGEDPAIDVEYDLSHLTLDVICDAAFGYDSKSVLSDSAAMDASFKAMASGSIHPLKLFLYRLVPFLKYIPTPDNLRLIKVVQMSQSIIQNVVQQRTKLDTMDLKSKTDLLSVLIQARNEESGRMMTEGTLRANVWTFLVAGHETSSTSLTWTLYYLAKDQEIQEKARKEILGISNDGILKLEEIDQLVYTTAVLKESLRRSPAVGSVLRETINDDWFGDILVPKGTLVQIPIVGIHNDAKYWPEPERFNPDRFLEKDPPTAVNSRVYLPFITGSRSCIGSKFAMLEMKVVLAKLLATFRFRIDDGQEEVGSSIFVTLKPCPAVKLRVSLV